MTLQPKWLADVALGIRHQGIVGNEPRKFGMQLTPEERAKFKSVIKQHRLYHIKWNTTCKELKTSKTTYYALIKENAQEVLENELKKENVLLTGFHERIEEYLQEAFSKYKKTGQVSFLQMAIATDFAYMKHLQSAGFVRKAEQEAQPSTVVNLGGQNFDIMEALKLARAQRQS